MSTTPERPIPARIQDALALIVSAREQLADGDIPYLAAILANVEDELAGVVEALRLEVEMEQVLRRAA